MMIFANNVIPAQAGIHAGYGMDSGLRRSDGCILHQWWHSKKNRNQ